MTAALEKIWKKRHLIISGPCSAETEEQVIETITQIASTGMVDIVRAGIWKPRTKPGMFEGAGTAGLLWMAAAKQAAAIPFMVEVATAAHVEEALRYGADMLWIGARTTVNPFSVQELADALRGTEVPIFIKNPINPDIDLWSGAIERMKSAGVQHIAMIHRGFSSYGNTDYRNPPMWHLAIEMKRRYPDMMLICDPSHISGNRTLLKSVAQKSIDLDYDGLMIESHIDPDHAWSDANQQITPQRLSALLGELVWRKNSEPETRSELNILRERIDRIDDELLSLLGERMHVADNIGIFKKQNNLTIYQAERWAEILERAMQKTGSLSLSEDFITKYFAAVHMESIDHQNKVMNAAETNKTAQ